MDNIVVIVLLIVIVVVVLVYFRNHIKSAMIGGAYRPMITLHKTEWCSYCKLIKPEWEKLKKDERYDFRENDEDENPTPGITGFPTITMQKGDILWKYNGPRDAESIKKWIAGPKTPVQ